MWREIHSLADKSKVPYLSFNKTILEFRYDDNFALGVSTDKAENFQGYHGKHVLIIVDEPPGISAGVWDAIAGTAAGGIVHMAMEGNPTTPSGAFFDAFNRERGLFNCITIDAFDTPNLEGITFEQLQQMYPNEGGPLDQNPISYLVSRRWVYDQHLSWWHGEERSSPSWMSRVRGQFPHQAQDALIRLSWLERAKRRAEETPVQDTGGRLVAGVDVGGRASETVVYLCEMTKPNPRILKFGAWRGDDTRGNVVAFLRPYRDRLAEVRVDAEGVGYNFALHLRGQGLPVSLVRVGLPADNKPNMRENDPALRFFNQKAQYYQHVADLLERDGIDGLVDDMTIGQLAGILHELDPRGRIKLESKDKARERGVSSADRAEALMLALGNPPMVYEYYTARELARLSSGRPRSQADDQSQTEVLERGGP